MNSETGAAVATEPPAAGERTGPQAACESCGAIAWTNRASRRRRYNGGHGRPLLPLQERRQSVR